MSAELFGKSNYNGGFKKRNWWKLKDGQSVFRLLPAMGDLGADGKWSVFWKIHYGYKNSKKQMRVFQSPEIKNNKTKMVESPDAALERIQKLKAQFEEAKKTGNVELAARLDKLVGQKGQFNLDSNHYINAMDQQGNIGLLRIRHRAKLALETTIKELEAKNIDPLSPENGRFLIFTRSGTGLDTSFKVTVLQEQINHPELGQVNRDIVHVLTPEIASRLLAWKDGKYVYREAARLDTLFKKPTSEEVARIVAEGEKAVDEILDAKDSDSASDAPTDEDDTETAAAAQAAPQPAPAPVQTAPAPAPAPVAAAPAPVATPAAAPALFGASAPLNTSQPTSTKTTAQAINDMSDDDFLKSLG